MIENPVPWPNGARVAVCFSFDVDMDSSLHVSHRGHAHTMFSTQSILNYDRFVVKRIVDIFRNFQIKQTFFIPAWCMERRPDLVDYILQGGHEIAHHGYIHENPNKQMTRDNEKYLLLRGIEIIERMTGKRPVGWRAPSYAVSQHSMELLIEEGFIYDASLMGDDVPYILKSKVGEIIELPSNQALDDWTQYANMPEFDHRISVRAPDDAKRVFMAEFDAMWKYRGMWIAVWHPAFSGRIARCEAIVRMIEEMRSRGGVWFATMEQIARHVMQCRKERKYEPRVEPWPMYPGPLSDDHFIPKL